MAYKSRYKPTNTDKYMGDPTNIVCRSMWERKVCKYLDINKNILRWGSEEIAIPYYSPVDKKYHRYFPDFIIKVKESTGQVKTYIVEVKPKKQTKPPTSKSSPFDVKTYAINEAKWKAAKEFCDDRRIGFKIITEEELGIKYVAKNRRTK